LSAEGSGAPFSDDAGSESGAGGLKGGNRLGNGGNQADRGPTEMASAARDHRGGAGDGRYRWLVPPASRLQAPSRDAFHSSPDISRQRIPPDFLTGWQPDRICLERRAAGQLGYLCEVCRWPVFAADDEPCARRMARMVAGRQADRFYPRGEWDL